MKVNSMEELAQLFASQFKQIERHNGTRPWVLKDGAKKEYPELESLIFDVHDATGCTLPDDFTYEFIVDGLTVVAEGYNLDDLPHVLSELTYYADIFQWFSENHGWVDEYVDEHGTSALKRGITELLRLAAGYHQQQVCEAVIDKLSDTYYAYFCDDDDDDE